MTTKKEKLMIIDGNALIHRSFHALPPTIQTKDGTIVNAVFGLTSSLIKAISDMKPKYVAFTMDKAGPTFRHKEFSEYKAHREKQPDELYAQFPIIKQVVRALSIPIYALEGFEADDLIGTITNSVNSDIEKIVVTGDMDTLQLVNDHTKIYAMSRGVQDSITYDAERVKEKYQGLGPKEMTDYKALRGDPSDNIPGVRGIGEKTAIELLTNYKTLDNLYKEIESKTEIDNIKPRIIELLKDQKENAYLSKKLATIKCDVEFDFDLEKTKFGDFNRGELETIIRDLDFNSLLSKINKLGIDGAEEEKIDKYARNKKLFNYQVITKEKDFNEFLTKLKEQKEFTFDTETDSKNALTANLQGISFCWEEGTAYYLETKVNSQETKPKVNDLFSYQNKEEKKVGDSHPWLEQLKPIFEDISIKKSGHNVKYDINVLSLYDIQVRGINFDTRIASYILNPGTRQHDLDSLALTILGHDKINSKDLLGEGKAKQEYETVGTKKLGLYSCEDADFTFKLIKPLKEKLKKEKLYDLFKTMEAPLIEILANMEQNGIEVNSKHLQALETTLSKQLEDITKKIYDLAGESFNINSPKQLKVILFEKLAISTSKINKTKTGLSTAAAELEKLQDEHAIIPLIEQHRELSKLLSTYIKALPELINQKTKRIHTSLNQTIAATGRLSSQSPNLQNIPTRTELGKSIREAFIAKEGYKLLSLDYSQVELRLAAHLSNDPKMIDAFNNDTDVHTLTASQINNVELKDVTKDMRREAKAINFGVLYGQGPRGLSQTADIPYAKAQEFIKNYFEVFSKVKEYIDKTITIAEETGQVETLFGRIRKIADINSNIGLIKKTAERTAINTPMQGSAADLIKLAMLDVAKLIKGDKDCKMLLQIHDELIFEVQKDKVKEYAKKLGDTMEKATRDIEFKVPIVVDAEVGDNWGELKEI